MQTYPINELERLTGIKAHTIRIWEKRYGLVAPERTDTNRRVYSDDQVRKLLNVSTLLAKGYKISKIAALSEGEINTEVQKDDKNEVTYTIYAGYINDLVKSMITFDEPAFEKIIAAAAMRLGMYEAILHVIYPFLNKIGLLWSTDQTEPVQEHFATNIIKRKLMVAIDGLLPPTEKNSTFLLFLPKGEWHDIGLLFANYIIRSKGYKTIYLGQDVPDANIEKLVQATNPKYMLLFYIAARPKEEITKQSGTLAKLSAGTHVLVAGNSELFAAEKSRIKNVTYLKGVDSLLELL
jgi:MerR family transcriptional regulator, light-induced transcriptional regulator